jgi:hypothetical protein
MFASLILSAVLLPMQLPPGEPVAMVLTARGAVTLQRDKEPVRRCGPMALLWPGDRVQAPEGGELSLVLLQDGRRERIKSNSTATIAAKGCTPAEAVEPLSAPKLSPMALEGLRGLAASAKAAIGVTRTIDTPLIASGISPLYGAAIASDRPSLTWPHQDKADAYLVEVFIGLDKDQRLLWKAPVKENRLTYPEKEKPLQQGRKYHWRVTALVGAGASAVPIVRSHFLVLTKDEIELLADLKPLVESKDPADLVMAAVFYEAFGVYGEALPLYERLVKLSPAEGNFHATLAKYYERAGRKDLARTARMRAKELGAQD